MSIRIIVLDNIKREIIAIGDKRTTYIKSTAHGELFDFQHVNDEATKLYTINESCYYATGMVGYLGKRILDQLLKVKHLKPSELIDFAKGINRFILPRFGEYPMDCLTLFGIYDDGRPFEWLGERDGSEFMRFAELNDFYIGLMGGSTGTDSKVGEYLKNLIRAKIPFEEALKKSILFASQVDAHHTISPTYDLIVRRF